MHSYSVAGGIADPVFLSHPDPDRIKNRIRKRILIDLQVNLYFSFYNTVKNKVMVQTFFPSLILSVTRDVQIIERKWLIKLVYLRLKRGM